MTNRRNMLLGFGALATGAISSLASDVTLTRPGTAFGTTVRITATAANELVANGSIDAGFAEIRRIERAFSLYDAKSELSVLNRLGYLRAPSNLMRVLMEHCNYYWETSKGAFDPTVEGQQRGWQNVIWRDEEISFAQPEMAISFNGIAQGYAADLALEAMRNTGAISAVVDTGETGISGSDEKLFAISNPRDPLHTLGHVSATTGFLATSGDYMTYFKADFSEHHIIDPVTGHSPIELASVTVYAQTGAEADALATAFMVMGRDAAAEFIRVRSDVGAVTVDKRGQISVHNILFRHNT